MKEDKAFTSLLIALVPMAAVLVVFAFVESYALLEASNALCALCRVGILTSPFIYRREMLSPLPEPYVPY